MPVTRAQMQQAIMGKLQETPEKPGFVSLWDYPSVIDEITDELAHMDGWFTTFTGDLVSGQSLYSLPGLYRTTSFVCQYTTGYTRPLTHMTTTDADAKFYSWRTNPMTGWPEYAIFEGQTAAYLYPQPNFNLGSGGSITITNTAGVLTYAVATGGAAYINPTFSIADPTGVGAAAVLTVTNGVITGVSGPGGSGYTSPVGTVHPGGITIEGFAAPSVAGPGGTNIWPGPNGVFPLRADLWPIAVWGAAHLRCLEFADNPSYAARAPGFLQRYEKLRRQYFRELQESNKATRTGDSPETGPIVDGGGGYY